MATLSAPPASMQFSCFDRYMKQFAQLDGWFWPDSIAIWDSLLSFQKSSGKRGNFFEIGCFRGKSAAMSTLHAREDEFCTFVDPNITIQLRQAVGSIKSNKVNFSQMRSTDLVRASALSDEAENCRWIHIDGEHTGMAVMNDMDVANLLLNDDGVVAVDDFFNPQYPQITAAVFDWLTINPRHFHLFFVGDNKGYLCRQRAAHSYLAYIKESLYADMAARDRPQVTIWKTTVASDMNTFGLTTRFGNFDYIGPDWDVKAIAI